MRIPNRDPFHKLVGQKNVKKKLNFYLKAFEKTGLCPFFGFFAAKGLGKTEFANAFARRLTNTDGSRRPLLEVNSSTIKNNGDFFEQIFIPLILDNEITILFDECHELPKDLTMALLTILDTTSSHTREFTWGETRFPFNFKHQTFMFATTESDKLFPPLKDRLTSIDFEPYSKRELGEILERAVECDIDPDTLKDLGSVVRGNARNAIMKAKDINLYTEAESAKVFNGDHYDKFCDTLGILPLGITCTERQILEILEEKGSCSLAFLAARTGLSSTALRRDHENYLLRQNLMEIDGKRKITCRGRRITKELKD
jgi:Holliday junction resolvasome RuvABC ATP-dependent DNA helicase subunit